MRVYKIKYRRNGYLETSYVSARSPERAAGIVLQKFGVVYVQSILEAKGISADDHDTDKTAIDSIIARALDWRIR
jgi:hypothetical protein